MCAATPSFIAEFPLSVTSADDAELCVRFDAARNIYNACLGESLRRLKLMRESKVWRAARTKPKGKARTDAFRAAQMAFGFTGTAIQKFAERCRDACWIIDAAPFAVVTATDITRHREMRVLRKAECYVGGRPSKAVREEIIPTVDVRIEIIPSDPERFGDWLLNGVGPQKAFGFGGLFPCL